MARDIARRFSESDGNGQVRQGFQRELERIGNHGSFGRDSHRGGTIEREFVIGVDVDSVTTL